MTSKRHVRWGHIVVVGVTVLTSSGCRRTTPATAPSPRLGSVEFQDVSDDSKNPCPLDVDALGAAVRRVLLMSKLTTADDPADAGTTAPRLRVRGRVGCEFVEVGAKGIVRSAVSVELTTRPSDAPAAINQALSAGGEQQFAVTPTLDRRALAQRLVERTTQDLLSGFVAHVRLQTASPTEIHNAIAADGGALREEAIRIAGTRGLREDVPTLLALLQDDSESLRDAALGALIALRERRAVKELTRNRSMRDRHEMRKVLEAIAILGGDEAQDYLGFVAESHDDAEIRKLAAEAKGRMERRADAAPR
jgi:hypothetical protein